MTNPTEIPQEDEATRELFEQMARRSTIKRIVYVLMGILLGLMTCFGAMGAPEFNDPTPARAPR